MIQQTIYSLLSGDPGIAAVVSARIFPVAIPAGQNIWPCLTFQLISGASDLTLDSKEISEFRFQIDAWGSQLLDAQNASQAVNALCDGFVGTVAGQRIKLMYNTIFQDTFETDARIFRVMTEYVVTF